MPSEESHHLAAKMPVVRFGHQALQRSLVRHELQNLFTTRFCVVCTGAILWTGNEVPHMIWNYRVCVPR